MLDRLTDAFVDIATQLRRIADAHTTDVAAHLDAPTTTPDDAPTALSEADRRSQYGQVLRRWGLLDEVNDPAAAEAFAVTDLLVLANAELEQARKDVAFSDEAARRASQLRQDMATERYAQDERIEELEARRDELADTLHDVLRHFVHPGHPGEPCLGAGWISVKTVARWRAVLNPPATEEQQPDAR